MVEFIDVPSAPRHDVPSLSVLPAEFDVVRMQFADGQVGRAAVYCHHDTWVAVSQFAEEQRWYGLGCSRDEAIFELKSAIEEDV